MKYLKHALLIVSLIVTLFYLTGCSKVNQESGLNQEESLEMVGTRFSSSPKPPGESDPKGVRYNYSLSPGQSFKGYYEVENIRPRKESYIILTFLDYELIPISLGGKKALSHRISLEANETKWWPIDTGLLPKGFHTYTMLLIWEPDNHSLDQEFRFATEFAFLSSNQANITVGGVDPPSKIDLTTKNSSTSKDSKNNYDGVRINKKDKDIDFWLKEEAKAGEKVDYYIHVANGTDSTMNYSLIALLDFKPINIIEDKEVIFVSVPPKTTRHIKTSFNAPKKKGTYELMVVRGVKPLTKINNEPDAMIEPSIRVPIIVN